MSPLIHPNLSPLSTEAITEEPRDLLPIECKNDTTVPSLLGLNYTQYCHADLEGNDLDNDMANTFQDCIDSCTHHQPLCNGVVWNTDNNYCWRKSNSASLSSLTPRNNTMSAMPFAFQITQSYKDMVCPYPNLSKQRMSTGLEFKILCAADLSGDNLWTSEQPVEEYMHAEKMEDCLESCAEHHPLCSRMTYVADLIGGSWLNCWLKTASRKKPSSWTATLAHSAEALLPKLERAVCKNNSLMTSEDGRVFKHSCDDYRVLNDTAVSPLKTYHEKSVENCMKRCNHKDLKCTAIAFDVGLQSGYQNCYLFDSIPPWREQHSNYTFLYLESLSSRYQAPPPHASAPKPEGWIVGGVLMMCVVSGLLAWCWHRFRYHRKKENRSHGPAEMLATVRDDLPLADIASSRQWHTALSRKLLGRRAPGRHSE